MPYHRLHYHCIWATHRREPLITSHIERQLYGTMLGKAKDLDCTVHAIGGIEDHIHIALQAPSTIVIADIIGQLKGVSTHYVNQQPGNNEFRWQRGYGVLTFGDASLTRIVNYIRNQKMHHRKNTTIAIYECYDD